MKNKTLVFEKQIVSADMEIIRRRLVAVDELLKLNSEYSCESETFIGPPHVVKLKLYKNE